MPSHAEPTTTLRAAVASNKARPGAVPRHVDETMAGLSDYAAATKAAIHMNAWPAVDEAVAAANARARQLKAKPSGAAAYDLATLDALAAEVDMAIKKVNGAAVGSKLEAAVEGLQGECALGAGG